MAGFSRIKLNPLDVVRDQFGVELNHITYDPSLRKADCHYQVIRQCAHDGTMMFTCDLLAETLHNLIKMESYAKKSPPNFSKLVAIKYTVGPLWLSTVYGQVQLPAGTYPGEIQRTRMRVACEYVYADETPQEVNQ